MSELHATFQSFGGPPEGLQPPPGKIHCCFSPVRIAGQYFSTILLLALGLGLMVVLLWSLPLPRSVLGGLAAPSAFGAWVYLVIRNDYGTVELDGNVLWARHLYTGHTKERSVEEIDCLLTVVHLTAGLETAIIEKIWGRVKAVDIRFRDGWTLRIQRVDPAMTHAQELIEAIVYRMRQVREIDAEVITFKGQPIVRSVHWKGAQPLARPTNVWQVVLVCLMLTALFIGTLGSYWGLQEQERQELGSVPPHEMTIAELIENGPGANRHVTITGFRVGGYTFENRSGSDTWSDLWIALFPVGVESTDIQVVLSSRAVRSPPELGRLLQAGKVTGICSQEPRTRWGAKLGPNLRRASRGATLASAWEIEEMSEPPSRARVTSILVGAAACFGAVLVLASAIFWKARSPDRARSQA